MIYMGGIKITVIFMPLIQDWYLGWYSLHITVFRFVLVINAINLIDGLDGLAAGITNDGDRDVSCVVLTVPLPEGTEYAVSGKRSDADIAYDSDGDGMNDAVRKADNETISGLTVEDCMPGDIDADGEITLSDAAAVLQILSGSDAEVCTDADVNGDGNIGLAEAVFVLKELAK